jgi:hypothetical protein
MKYPDLPGIILPVLSMPLALRGGSSIRIASTTFGTLMLKKIEVVL